MAKNVFQLLAAISARMNIGRIDAEAANRRTSLAEKLDGLLADNRLEGFPRGKVAARFACGVCGRGVSLDGQQVKTCQQEQRFPLCLACRYFRLKGKVPALVCKSLLADLDKINGVADEAFEALVAKALGKKWDLSQRQELPIDFERDLEGILGQRIWEELHGEEAEAIPSTPVVPPEIADHKKNTRSAKFALDCLLRTEGETLVVSHVEPTPAVPAREDTTKSKNKDGGATGAAALLQFQQNTLLGLLHGELATEETKARATVAEKIINKARHPGRGKNIEDVPCGDTEVPHESKVVPDTATATTPLLLPPPTPAPIATGTPGVRNIPLTEIRLDGETQPRQGTDTAVIEEYAALIKSGVKFPPIEAIHDGRHYWLWDGFHRYHAAAKAGRKDIRVNVIVGTVEDAKWRCLAANKTHGLKRTNADKQRAVGLALAQRPDWSDRAIADHVGVDHTTVGDARKRLTGGIPQSTSPSPATGGIPQSASAPATGGFPQSTTTRTGKDGRTINTAKIGKKADKAPETSIPPGGYAPILDDEDEADGQAEAPEQPQIVEVRTIPTPDKMIDDVRSLLPQLDREALRSVWEMATKLAGTSANSPARTGRLF